MSDLQREESFRTSLKNQKRRLSTPKQPKMETAETPKDNLLSVPTAPKPIKDSLLRQAVTKQIPPTLQLPSDCYDIEELSPLSTPASSPFPPASPNPIGGSESERFSPFRDSRCSTPATPGSRCSTPDRGGSPVPPDSPLLCRTPPSPSALRAREFHKELRRARSFRASMERSRENSRTRERSDSSTPTIPVNPVSQPTEMSFKIRPALGNRKGWKIMPEEGDSVESAVLQKVVALIKELEFSGHAVPERLTLKV